MNIGYGSDLTISELGHAVKDAVGFEGEIDFDRTKPDGTPRKLMDFKYHDEHGLGAADRLGRGPTLDLRLIFGECRIARS